MVYCDPQNCKTGIVSSHGSGRCVFRDLALPLYGELRRTLNFFLIAKDDSAQKRKTKIIASLSCQRPFRSIHIHTLRGNHVFPLWRIRSHSLILRGMKWNSASYDRETVQPEYLIECATTTCGREYQLPQITSAVSASRTTLRLFNIFAFLVNQTRFVLRSLSYSKI